MNVYTNNRNQTSPALKLWYRQPAAHWQDALPLGNGRIGAMIYGRVDTEVMDLSESTCFSGEASFENNSEDAAEFFQKARAALVNEDYESSRQFIQGFIGKRLNYGTHLPLGHLVMDTGHSLEEAGEYHRSLHLDTALTCLDYCVQETGFHRTAFASNPHQVMVLRVVSDQPGSLQFSLSLDGGNNPHTIQISQNKDFLLSGNAYESSHSDGKTGVAFHCRMRILLEEGTLEADEKNLHIKHSSSALILIAIETDFNHEHPSEICKSRIEHAATLTYEELLHAHIQDHKALFDRMEFTLGNTQTEDVPTDLLLEKVKSGIEVPSLTTLMFQYGRYLLIASSRENSPLPAHLQGVWNDGVACRIGWTCDMHLDINTQMNYWPAEVTNLSECHEPLFQWIENKLIPSGRITAQKSYGLKGWIAELVSNAWGFTAPYWHYNLSPCPTGGVWVSTHLWEHYLFTRNTTFLKEHAYPVIRESVEFFIDYVFEDQKSGHLTCGPSISPENKFIVNGEAYAASIGSTYEIVMIREIFNIFIRASKALGYRDKFVDRVTSAFDRLLPFQIGAKGELKEWAHDHEAQDPQHRHTSHLLSLFPFSQITPENTPDLAEAAKVCIKLRMTPEENWEDTGWARSMLMLYSARLWERESVYNHILSMQRYLTNSNLMVKHPPTRGAPSFADVYELDGNTGFTACIAEILLQSHNDEIHLLPVLPANWDSGCIKGLCARGGFEVDIVWKKGILSSAAIYSKNRTPCKVRYGDTKISFSAEAGRKYEMDSHLKILMDTSL